MAKNKKKTAKSGISPEKIATKYENAFILLSAADVLLSLSSNGELLLEKMGAEHYITDDDLNNITVYTNMVLQKSSIPPEIKKTFGHIFDGLLEIALRINDPAVCKTSYPLYEKLTKIITEFVKQHKFDEYASYVRAVINASDVSLFVMPLFQLIDIFYDRDYAYLDIGKTKQLTGAPVGSERISIALCDAFSIDNINHLDAAVAYGDMLRAYMSVKYKSISYLIDELNTDVLNCIAAAKYRRYICTCNKYEISASAYVDSYQNLCRYNMLATELNVKHEKLLIIMSNALLKLNKDLLTDRRFIMKNGKLPLQLDLADLLETDKPCIIDNIILNETDVSFSETEKYRILYIDYTCAEHRQHIPLIVDNLPAMLYGYNSIDLYVVLCVLSMYEVFHIPPDMDYEEMREICRDILPHFAEYENNSGADAPILETKTKNSGFIRHMNGAEITVNAYVRKLPRGQHASEEAKQLAKKYYVKLPDDCTMVSEYTRRTNNKTSD